MKEYIISTVHKKTNKPMRVINTISAKDEAECMEVLKRVYPLMYPYLHISVR